MNFIRRILKGPGGINELLRVSFPIIISQMSESLMMLTDRFFLAPLGKIYPSAAIVGGFSSFLLNTLFVGMLGYITALVAQYRGAKQNDNCPLCVTQGGLIAILAAPIIVIGGYYLAPLYFKWTGVHQEEMVYSLQYFNIVNFSSLFILMKFVFSGFFSGVGRTMIVMYANLIGLLVNVPLNYLFINGYIGEYFSGIRGAALATLVSSICVLITLLYAYFKKSNRMAYKVRESLRIDYNVIKKIIRFGGPTGLEFFLVFFAFNTFMNFFHSYGPDEALAMTIAFNWETLVFLPIWGLNIGQMSLVGKYLGAKKIRVALRALISALMIAALITIVSGLFILITSDKVINIFMPDNMNDLLSSKTIIDLTRAMLHTMSFYCIIDSIRHSFGAFLRASGDTTWCMYAGIVGYWLMLILTYISIKKLAWSPLQTWYIFVGIVFLLLCFFTFRFFQGRWKSIRVV